MGKRKSDKDDQRPLTYVIADAHKPSRVRNNWLLQAGLTDKAWGSERTFTACDLDDELAALKAQVAANKASQDKDSGDQD